MLVVGVDGEIEVEFMGFVIADRVCSDKSSPFDICSIVIASAVDSVELLGVVAVIEVIGYGVLYKKQLICVADVVFHFVVGISQVNSGYFLGDE
jgi:hypothetical protein